MKEGVPIMVADLFFEKKFEMIFPLLQSNKESLDLYHQLQDNVPT